MAKIKPTARKKKKAPRKGTQEFLPGTEPERNQRVYAAAVIYRNLMRKRVAASNLETDSHDTLLSIMHEEKLNAYNDGDINLVLSSGREKVKILEAKSDDDTKVDEKE